MKSHFRLFCVTILVLASGLVNAQGTAPGKESEPAYGIGSWDSGTLGNHRAIVHVSTSGDAAWAHVVWRRRDKNPEQKAIIVVDVATGKSIANVASVAITQYAGDIVFQPVSGAGDYNIYFMPYKGDLKASYPKITYREPAHTADAAWLTRNQLQSQPGAPTAPQADLARFPPATNVRLESIDDFNRFTSMELIASQPEVTALLNQHPSSTFFVFPEDRTQSIRMTDQLPAAWVRRGPGQPIVATADQGEFYVFQLGLWAARRNLNDVKVAFGSLAQGG